MTGILPAIGDGDVALMAIPPLTAGQVEAIARALDLCPTWQELNDDDRATRVLFTPWIEHEGAD